MENPSRREALFSSGTCLSSVLAAGQRPKRQKTMIAAMAATMM
jgi:hypothetical protein